MKRFKEFFEFGNVVPTTLLASAILAFLGVTLMNTFSEENYTTVDMRVEPTEGSLMIGDTLDINVVVSSEIPVNVFAGELGFDPEILAVKSIDYNTSIADLWAVRPWFSNGEGTLNFAGGTTRSGGFIGTGNIITVKFEAKKAGDVYLSFGSIRILQHDGFGTDAKVQAPVDALFTVAEEVEKSTVLAKDSLGASVKVVEKPPSTDLNNDSKQSVLDISIFMSDLISQDLRSDFNLDGKVNTKDLSIITQAD